MVVIRINNFKLSVGEFVKWISDNYNVDVDDGDVKLVPFDDEHFNSISDNSFDDFSYYNVCKFHSIVLGDD